MERQNLKSIKEYRIGILSFLIELDRNSNLIFSSLFLFSFEILWYGNEPIAESNELNKIKVNKKK